MFQEASAWELRLGKVASIVFTGLFSFLVISNLDDFAEDEWWHLAFDYSAYTAGFLFYTSLIVYWGLLQESEGRSQILSDCIVDFDHFDQLCHVC